MKKPATPLLFLFLAFAQAALWAQDTVAPTTDETTGSVGRAHD